MTMNKLNPGILVILLSLLGGRAAFSLQDPVSRSITGAVVYPNDSPAKGFVVLVIGASPMATARAQGFTDNNGKFNVEGLRPGDYVVAPYKEEENSGYPLALFRFYQIKPHQVRISGEALIVTTKITLGKPLVSLVGRIVTVPANIGARAQISLHLANDSDANLSFASTDDGCYKVPVPTGVPIVMVVNTPGSQQVKRTFTAESISGEMTINVEVPANKP